jgi:subtilisin-like proprotein convertase family protein
LLYTFNNLNQAVPDGDATGLVNVQSVSDAPGMTVTDLNVTLNLSGTGPGGFNGDLYVTLQHETGYAVLLNRVGARSGATFGYSDSGLNITLDESAPGDVHVYRQVLNCNHSTALGGALTGTWRSDARTSDPATVLETDAQSANLQSFNGVSVNGQWTLFVSDLSAGAPHQLDSWGIQITAVPEPGPWGMAAGTAALLFTWARRRWQSKS